MQSEQHSYRPATASTNFPADQISRLFNRYSASQDYYYTRPVNDLLEQIVTRNTIAFEDQCFYDSAEQMLKRVYLKREFKGKMLTINEYYFYHRDMPTIFHRQVEKPYRGWLQRRQKLQYRKLKQALNLEDSHVQQPPARAQPAADCSNLLKDISEYNPRSGNYYLRAAHPTKARADNSSLASIERELKDLLSRCSFVQDLSLQHHSQPRKAPGAYSFRKKSIPQNPIRPPEEIRLRDKITLNFHESFKRPQSNVLIKVRGNKCGSAHKQEETRPERAISTQSKSRGDSSNKVRIKLQRHNSESRTRTRERMPESRGGRPSREEQFTDTRINSNSKLRTGLYGSSGSQQLSHGSQQLNHGSHSDLKSYKTTTLRKVQPKNFLTLNIEPLKQVDLQKAKFMFGVRLRGV